MSMFLNLPSAEVRLRPVTTESFPRASSWKATQKRITSCTLTNPFYKTSLTRIVCFVVGILIVLGAICCRIAYLANAGLLFSPKILAIALSSLVLLGGGIGVLCKIARKIDVLYGEKIQPFAIRKWEQVILCEKRGQTIRPIQDPDMYMDVSLLDKQGSGIAPVYTYPPAKARTAICFIACILLPIITVVRVLYNAFRFLLIPFYIVFQMIRQLYQEDLPFEEQFICSDIFREMSRSFVQAVKAPFYGVACYLASLYGLLNPLSGRVIMASVERDWNNDVIRSRGIWGIFCEKNCLLEGGGTRSGLGQHAWYLLGCFQPFRLFLLKDGEIVSGARPSIQAFPENKEYLTSYLYGAALGRLTSR
ncbi:membrane protein [Chlamydia muridarum str. Nigg CM972]|nr:membrane protein [Chlamydia muridarum str. Nigg3 CMUT3-5]AHH23778.1 membrane protein [Chlamydia muridarum str. Nigg CM972]